MVASCVVDVQLFELATAIFVRGNRLMYLHVMIGGYYAGCTATATVLDIAQGILTWTVPNSVKQKVISSDVQHLWAGPVWLLRALTFYAPLQRVLHLLSDGRRSVQAEDVESFYPNITIHKEAYEFWSDPTKSF